MDILCDFNVGNWNAEQTYICGIKRIKAVDTTSSIGPRIKGDHVTGKADEDVRAVYVGKNLVLNEFPRWIGKQFQNVKYLKVSDCGLREIFRRDLQGFGNLEQINLSYNQLKMLPSDLFADTPMITSMRFNDNKIEFVSSKILASLDNNRLKLVDFGKNPSINYCYRKVGAFKIDIGSLNELKNILDENCKHPFELCEKAYFRKIAQNMSEDISAKDLAFICKSELIPLAIRHNVPELKERVEEIVEDKINETNVMEIFRFGSVNKSDRLKRAAFKKIQRMNPEVQLDEQLMNDEKSLSDLLASQQQYRKIIQRYGKRARADSP